MHSKTGAKSAAPSFEQSRLQAAPLDGFPGEEAMRKEGERLISEPAHVAPRDEEFPPIPDTAPDPVER